MMATPFCVRPGFGEVPVGSVLAFAGPLRGDAAPDGPFTDPLEAWGWMHCDGRGLSTHGYPELFAALGYVYGGADTQFKLPDLRGYFLRGAGGGGVDPDASQRTLPPGGKGASDGVGSIQQFALQTHQHGCGLTPAPSPGPPTALAGAPPPVPSPAPAYTGDPASSAIPPLDVLVSVHETRPVNVYVYYIIKFTYGLSPLLR